MNHPVGQIRSLASVKESNFTTFFDININICCLYFLHPRTCCQDKVSVGIWTERWQQIYSVESGCRIQQAGDVPFGWSEIFTTFESMECCTNIITWTRWTIWKDLATLVNILMVRRRQANLGLNRNNKIVDVRESKHNASRVYGWVVFL